MRKFVVFLVVCIVVGAGCVGRTSEKIVEESPTPPQPAKIAELHLSSAKATYGSEEPIPVEATIQMGKFDLFVPYASVEGSGAFTQLVIKDATGEVVRPYRPIRLSSQPKTLVRQGREVSCIQGIALMAGEKKKVLLDNLRAHYKLTPGNYSLQSSIDLKVYKEMLKPQSPQILEIQREIAAIQADSQLPAASKQEAIKFLRDDIEFIQSNEEESNEIYLPLDSLRGSTVLESNRVVLKIQ